MLFCGRVTLEPSNYIFALTSLSLTDLPRLCDLIDGFCKLFSATADFVLNSSFPSLFVGYFVLQGDK